MKILFITNSLIPTDGWGRYGHDVVRLFADGGNDIAVVCAEKSGMPKIVEIDILDDPLKYILNLYRCFADGRKLAGVVSDFDPDVLHFIVEPYVGMLPFAGDIKARKILTVHGSYAYMPDLFSNPLARWLSERLTSLSLKKIDNIVAVSNFSRRLLLGKIVANGLGVKEEKISFMPNWIYPNESKKNPEKSKNEKKRILFVGGVKTRKGVLEALEAIKCYSKKHSDNFTFDIVGKYDKSDPYCRRALELAEKSGLSGRIFFRGRVDEKELNDYYGKADLFIMLPISVGVRFEGFGLVYLEANAFGVPCIGSMNCGAEDAIADGRTGYLVDPRNPDEVAEKIHLVLDQNSIRGEDCREWAMDHGPGMAMTFLSKLYE